MQLEVKGKNLDVSDSIRTYAEQKLEKLRKQLAEETIVHVELTVEKNPKIRASQVAEATIFVKGDVLRAREASPDMKSSLDGLSE
jgi:putative sigma-54 modulation protein